MGSDDNMDSAPEECPTALELGLPVVPNDYGKYACDTTSESMICMLDFLSHFEDCDWSFQVFQSLRMFLTRRSYRGAVYSRKYLR